jgi:hypothetical protein
MGRALYSTKYTVAVATPELAQPVADSPYAKWSRDSNYFDPDSDEFFIDAQYEAFVDPNAPPLSTQPAESRSDSPLSEVSSGSSSAASDNEQQDSSNEEESDNPVTLMARLSRSDPDWANTLLRLGRAMERRRANVDAAADQPSVEQALGVVEDESAIDTPTGSTTPMPIPFASPLESNVVSASEIGLGTPHSFQMTPPSPANVSPRLLSWGHRRGGSSVTNASTRMSGSTIPPARVRVYGFAA